MDQMNKKTKIKHLEYLPDIDDLETMRRIIRSYVRRNKINDKSLEYAYEDGIGAGYILGRKSEMNSWPKSLPTKKARSPKKSDFQP